MLSRHKTALVFWTAVLLSLLSIALVFLFNPWFLILLGASIGFNFWCVIKSDGEGFVKSKHLRRAYEPARRFNAVQMIIILALIIGQISIGTYALLT